MVKVCHMTSAHSSEDVRIFYKECVSLAKAGYDVYEVAKGKSYDKNGVHIIGVGSIYGSRLKRMTQGARNVYKKALKLDCDIYHFHDPELLPYGLKLKKKGKKVIFDSHEDLHLQIMEKEWIPKFLRKVVSKIALFYELFAVSRINAVVSATKHIDNVFKERCLKRCVICNYPILDEFCVKKKNFEGEKAVLCYTGSHIQQGLIENMREAIKGLNVKFIVAGEHKIGTDGQIEYIGRINREQVIELYSKSKIGIQLGKKVPNGEYSLPIKIFEYMASGIPSVIKDYPYFKEIFEKIGVSICVDPENTNEISNAIQYLLDNPNVANQMGENGRKAVEREFNWGIEEKKLLDLYGELLNV